ncbi:hypothetical protein BDQ17DRAFT_490192 [Cyathus striatus]|nr:hypothetical protein BDQ17DRAFT_490192 [Cyathus striatus]
MFLSEKCFSGRSRNCEACGSSTAWPMLRRHYSFAHLAPDYEYLFHGKGAGARANKVTKVNLNNAPHTLNLIYLHFTLMEYMEALESNLPPLGLKHFCLKIILRRVSPQSLVQLRLANIRACNAVQRCSQSRICQLPDELLVKIFTYVQDGNISILRRSPGQIWDLQQVCVRWRNIVQSAPSLWNNFEVRLQGDVDPETMTKRIQSCLKFSGTAPLSMTLLPLFTHMPFLVFEDIANHAHRWKSLTVDGCTIDHALEATAAMGLIEHRGLSQLHSLFLSGGHEVDTFHHVFQTATALEEVTITRSTLPNVSYFPYTHVKRFTVERCEIGAESEGGFEIDTIFYGMPSLEELTWKLNGGKLRCTSPAISLPFLHTLNVSDYSEELYKILPKLSVPSLSALRVESRTYDASPLLSMCHVTDS